MVMLNARCNTCRAVFPAGIVVENSTNITFHGGSTIGPCPRCGGWGSLLANNTTFDVVNERVTIRRGNLAPQDLLAFASTLSGYRDGQDNRNEVEQQISAAFPELGNTARRLPADAFLRLVTALLALLAFWQVNPRSQREMMEQVSQLAQEAESQVELTLAEQYERYEAGKQSLHALEKKILRFFPELASHIKGLPWDVMSFFAAFLVIPLERWYNDRKDRRKLEEFVPSPEQTAEVVKALEDIKLAIQQNNTETLAEMRRLIDEVKVRRDQRD